MMLHIILIFSILEKTSSVSLSAFYPFGQLAGDDKLPPNDDGSSPNISINSLFPFFNHQHRQLIVNTNGAISFLGTLSQYKPDPFPLKSNRRIVVPFWADADIRQGGNVWYRETTDETLLREVSDEVRKYFTSQPRFHAAWMFIATWDNVAYFGCESICHKRNTFQAVLVTNGQHSFTIFNYDKIEWTAGTASDGIPAQVGFDAGNGVNYFAVNVSRTPAIININSYSNVNIPGKFVFRIDFEKVEQGGCNTEGFLTIVPQYDLSMLGGEKLTIGGPCLLEDAVITARFNGQENIPCEKISDYRFTCITPMFYTTNDVTVDVTIKTPNGPKATHRGIITPINLAKTMPKVIRKAPAYWRRGPKRAIEWDADDLSHYQHVDVDLFVLTEDVNGVLRWRHSKKVISGVPVSNENATFILDLNETVAVVRISPNTGTKYKEAIWSDVFSVFPNKQTADFSCSQWLTHDVTLPNIDDVDMQACPCTLQQALIDLGRFQRDPMCNMLSNSNRRNTNCLYNMGAQHCVRLSSKRDDGFGISCCYNSNGNFIDVKSENGGATKQRYNYLGDNGNNIPFLSNFYYDVRPFLYCCMYYGRSVEHSSQNTDIIGIQNSDQCERFFERRPPGNCQGYIPPAPAAAHGDPHIQTLDGFSYTFNGIGEYTLLTDVNGTFKIDVRMEQVTDDQGKKRNASVFTAVVAHSKNKSDVAGVTLNSIRLADVLINNQIVEFADTQWLDFKGLSVILTNGNESGVVTKDILITFEDPKVGIKCVASQHVLNIITVVGDENLRGNVEGLLGNFDGNKTNDLKSRRGEVISQISTLKEIHQKFGETWRIQENDSLFKYPIGKTFSSFQNPHFIPQFVTTTNVSNETKEICGDDMACIFDYDATGMKEIAKTTSSMNRIIQVFDKAAIIIASCGVPTSIGNGTWNTTGFIEGSVAMAFCNDGFLLDTVLIYYCGGNGLWMANGEVLEKISCLKIPNCGEPPSMANGTWNTTGLLEGSIAQAVCDDGFLLDTALIYQCEENGLWMANGEVLDKVSCLKVANCGEPPSMANGTWNTTGLLEGSVAQAVCDNGFLLDTALIYQCKENGLWMADGDVLDKVSCLKVPDCGEPPSIANGTWNTTGLLEGSVALVVCDDGFLLDTALIYQCKENGLWMANGEELDKVLCLKEKEFHTEFPEPAKTGQLLGGVTAVIVVISVAAVIVIRWRCKLMRSYSTETKEMNAF